MKFVFYLLLKALFMHMVVTFSASQQSFWFMQTGALWLIMKIINSVS